MQTLKQLGTSKINCYAILSAVGYNFRPHPHTAEDLLRRFLIAVLRLLTCSSTLIPAP